MIRYGEKKSFSTLGTGPSISATVNVSNITDTSAYLEAQCSADGGSPVTSKGFCLNTTGNPTTADELILDLGAGTGSLSGTMNNLESNTTYYVRAFATNATTTSYSNVATFTTATNFGRPCEGRETVPFFNAQYNTVQMGSQCWLASNLRVEGDAMIPGGVAEAMQGESGLLYAYSDFMRGNVTSTTGKVQGICPNGWHLPTPEEFEELKSYMQSESAFHCSGSSNIAKALAYKGQTNVWTSSAVDCTPTVRTNSVTAVEEGIISASGTVMTSASPVTAAGFCWNTTGDPTIADSHTSDVHAITTFTRTLRNFTPGVTYYVRAYATSDIGTSYGEVRTVTTQSFTCGTSSLRDVDGNEYEGEQGADGNDGFSPVVTAIAVEGGTQVTITDANGDHTFLIANGVNGQDGTNGQDGQNGQDGADGDDGFSPVVTTTAVEGGTLVTITDANGEHSFTITNGVNGQDGVGVPQTLSLDGNNLSISDGNTVTLPAADNSQLEDLQNAIDSLSQVIDDMAFVCGTNIQDIDGNTYHTVQIGNQCWMQQNLRTTRYADGTPIPQGVNTNSATNPLYYDYTASSFDLEKRGYFYNWPAVMNGAAASNANPSGVQGVCPQGWHVPSHAPQRLHRQSERANEPLQGTRPHPH